MSAHKKLSTDDQNPKTSTSGLNPEVNSISSNKESEPKSQEVEEAKLLKEVVERSAEADRTLEKEVQENIKEVKLSRPEIKVPEDIAKHGVKSPQADASQIVVKGSDLELPISESAYKSGELSKVDGQRTRQKSIIGVSSLAAFALWVGRVVKVAHKHTKKVIFRNGEKNAN